MVLYQLFETYNFQKPATNITDAISQSLASGERNGYAPSTGYPDARAAVAQHISKNQGVRYSHLTYLQSIAISPCTNYLKRLQSIDQRTVA